MFLPIIILLTAATLVCLIGMNLASHRFNDPAMIQAGKPYRTFFNISLLTFISTCICFGVLVAQDNYSIENYSKPGPFSNGAYVSMLIGYIIFFTPILILLGLFAGYAFFKLKKIPADFNIGPGASLTLKTVAVIEVIFGIFCLFVSLFGSFYGFGRFDGF